MNFPLFAAGIRSEIFPPPIVKMHTPATPWKKRKASKAPKYGAKAQAMVHMTNMASLTWYTGRPYISDIGAVMSEPTLYPMT